MGFFESYDREDWQVFADDDEEGMAKGNIAMDGASTKEQQGAVLITLPDGYRPARSAPFTAQGGVISVAMNEKLEAFNAEAADVRAYADRDYIGRLEAENRRLSVELQDMKNYTQALSVMKDQLSESEREATRAVTNYQAKVASVLGDVVFGRIPSEREVVMDIVERLGIQEMIEASYLFVVDVTVPTPHYTTGQVLALIQSIIDDQDSHNIKATVREFSEHESHCC